MERRTERRLSVKLPGSYRPAGSESRGMFFSQISTRGCRMTAEDLRLQGGDAVELFLGPVGPIDGRIRWTLPNTAGVEFDVALDSAIVGYFAAFIEDAA